MRFGGRAREWVGAAAWKAGAATAATTPDHRTITIAPSVVPTVPSSSMKPISFHPTRSVYRAHTRRGTPPAWRGSTGWAIGAPSTSDARARSILAPSRASSIVHASTSSPTMITVSATPTTNPMNSPMIHASPIGALSPTYRRSRGACLSSSRGWSHAMAATVGDRGAPAQPVCRSAVGRACLTPRRGSRRAPPTAARPRPARSPRIPPAPRGPSRSPATRPRPAIARAGRPPG